MARFFFHVRTPHRLEVDEEGLECPDLRQARHEAVLGIRDLVMDASAEGYDATNWAIEITDGDGRRLDRILFRDAVSH
jgi:hypothetical protein